MIFIKLKLPVYMYTPTTHVAHLFLRGQHNKGKLGYKISIYSLQS